MQKGLLFANLSAIIPYVFKKSRNGLYQFIIEESIASFGVKVKRRRIFYAFFFR